MTMRRRLGALLHFRLDEFVCSARILSAGKGRYENAFVPRRCFDGRRLLERFELSIDNHIIGPFDGFAEVSIKPGRSCA